MVANPNVPANDQGLPYLALEQIEALTGRLVQAVDGVSDEAGIVHQKGDVRFGKLRPALGKVFLAEAPGRGSSELVVLRPDREKMDPLFLKFVLLSQPFVEFATIGSYGSKMPRTSWEQLSQFRFRPPKIEIQVEIAKGLEKKLGQIDLTIDNLRMSVDLLNERRQALITAAVTGQLEI